MTNRKIKAVLYTALSGCLLASLNQSSLYAVDFEGKEENWLNKCSVAQESEAEAQKCNRFKQYYAGISSDLEDEASSLNTKISSIKNNIEEISTMMKQLQSLIDKLDKSIERNEVNIRTIEIQIEKLNVEIKKKQRDIDQRNKIITDRMLNEQAVIGTNMNVEVIMGSNNLVDMIRKVDGLRRITDSDQTEIKKLQKHKDELNHQKSEENRKQEAELNEKMRSVQVDIASIENNMIDINTSVAGKLNFSSNGTLIMPVQGGSVSAGTWAYPDGGVHLGLDIATPVGTSLVAPADGIILYANNPVPSNGGFLNNWVGYPAGGGNTIHMLIQAGGTTYAISFFHLSREGFAVSAGTQVKKGQLLALTGHSGNSTGAHCHIEVINLGTMSVSSAITQFRSTADFAWGCGWGVAALNRSCDASGTPCRERPETIF